MSSLSGEEEESPYTVHLPLLHVYSSDLLSLPSNSLEVINATLQETTQHAVQKLVNELWKQEKSVEEEGVFVALGRHNKSIFPLPREKSIPEPKPLTRWETFAKQKGIQKKKRDRLVHVPNALNGDKDAMAPRWGYKSKPEDWVTELKGDKEDTREADKKERKAKNTSQRVRNEKEALIPAEELSRVRTARKEKSKASKANRGHKRADKKGQKKPSRY